LAGFFVAADIDRRLQFSQNYPKPWNSASADLVSSRPPQKAGWLPAHRRCLGGYPADRGLRRSPGL